MQRDTRSRPKPIAIWDIRCSIHCANGDYPVNERRVMWRTTVMDEDWPQREELTA